MDGGRGAPAGVGGEVSGMSRAGGLWQDLSDSGDVKAYRAFSCLVSDLQDSDHLFQL